jgi:hypothetical protein
MKTPRTLLAVLFAAGLPLASCDRQRQAAAGPLEASLTADPNPVPPGEDAGKTTISWQTGTGTTGEVYVVTNSNPETLFAQGPKGQAEAPWIMADSMYEFRLYSGMDHKTILRRVTVTRSKN